MLYVRTYTRRRRSRSLGRGTRHSKRRAREVEQTADADGRTPTLLNAPYVSSCCCCSSSSSSRRLCRPPPRSGGRAGGRAKKSSPQSTSLITVSVRRRHSSSAPRGLFPLARPCCLVVTFPLHPSHLAHTRIT